MLKNRVFRGAAVVALLLVINLARWLFSGWGLITVHAHQVPLARVIKSIERQGWVTIYTNIDPSASISMDVDHVSLAEAMETLTANIPAPEPTAGSGAGPGGPPPGRAGGQGPRGFGGGGFAGGAQWKLAFFTAPSSAQVKQEIRAFQSGDGSNDDTKVYSYPTPLQFLATESGMPAADPRQQVWPGMKPQATTPTTDTPATDPAPAPETVQDYLSILAQSADIWIMAPTSWTNKVSSAPGAGGPIASAVKSVVGRAHGAVEQALIVYQRSPGQRGSGGRGGFIGSDTGWSMEDRMRNAINGLPPESRGDALNQLSKEVSFQQQVRAAPADQRREMRRQHFMDHLGGMDNWRRSPEQRAQMYQHAVSNRQTVRGQ